MNDKCVVLNAKKMNFDGKLDFSVLSSDVTVYDDTTKEQLSERIQGADIIVTKEMPVSGEMIQYFPESVKLICEAGTGYNNIDLEAARKKGITVCNIPAYSTERVAHTAIMMMLNLSSTMQVQMKMLARGNPGAVLYLAIGSDMLLSFEGWHRWQDILRIARVVVTSRDIGDAPALHAKAKLLDPSGGRILFAPVQALPMASSQLRARLAAGEECEAELPEEVRSVIRREGLYRNTEGSSR